MAERHPASCAARLRDRAETEGWPADQAAATISQCCSVGLLRAHRLAQGWTLQQAVDAYRTMTRGVARAARVDQEQLRIWETRPARRPRAQTIDLLCRLYETSAEGLGLTGDYTPPTTSTAPVKPIPGLHRNPAPAAPQPAADALDQILDRTRHGVDRTLARATVSPTQLDLLEERLLDLRRQYLVTAPVPTLGLMLPDLEEIQLLASERQPATVQMRLSEMTAVLATLVADALMKLGRLRQSGAWYATARAAADDSTDTDLRARVRAQAAMLPYYYGPLTTAVALSREARILARHHLTPTAAFSAAAEARALARHGDTTRAHEAIQRARDAFDRASTGDPDDAFAFPERRLLLYLSGALTYLGHTHEAERVQTRALTLYGSHGGIDPALIHLDQAICLARERHLSEACRLATSAYLELPPGQRTELLEARAHDVLSSIPERMRSAPAARELGEALALPTSGK
ncbi:helix-turn-helix domain-containing protein [Streptomyces albipurpureus]|uniref:Helix-turn-helix transcriptional regulator n=1 Tax=Streptomyces albipurpureus TaxID=2897419 RepID=A0ABT0UXE7_9ACTN|nr:helix-turn-helix transcriptional regulator [Streptomyces sp. CWNU-1]MCM2392018.1 helix-turn-helix transcriptional regulator [Streptomyces sp. CWNU-1]